MLAFCVNKNSVKHKMEGSSLLIWGVLFGAIGLGYFTYGKKQKAVVPLFVGMALFIFPYFISNIYPFSCWHRIGSTTIFCKNMTLIIAFENDMSLARRFIIKYFAST